MEITYVGCQKDRDDSLQSNSERSVKRLNLSLKQLHTKEHCIKDPDCVVSLDEKFLKHCLELIHISASSKIFVNFSSRMMDLLAEMKGEETFDTARFVFECPLPHQFGTSDNDVNLRRIKPEDDEASKSYSFMNSPGVLGVCASHKLMKEQPSTENHKFGPQFLHNRHASVSSANSTCSDQSSAASASLSQGMLHCTWRDGSPHFVFSVDGQNEVYAANLSKVISSEDKALDHVYLLHSIKDIRKAHEIYDVNSHLIGKVKVSTSLTLCPNNSRIMETEFILYGNNEKHVGGVQTPSHSLRKIKGLSKKVVDVFKTSNSSKQRAMSKFSGSSYVHDRCSWDPQQDTSNSYDDDLGEADLLERHLPPNFELVAVIVRDHLPEPEIGGWGLKFLKKARIIPTSGSIDNSVASECCVRNSKDCSTSIDILVPAGLHGGPKTRNGGPSSLIERWKSGGCCDCSGWDLGCPLTVLNSRPSKEVANEGECKAFDLIIKGSEHTSPTLRMMNVQDGLYSIHFQSILSDLQSFSIAVALVHARRPKYVQALK